MIVTIIGFMASGKSSVGRKLSGLLSCNFIDLDTYIEDKYGRSIKDIFANEGEDGFRTKEEEALEELLAMYSTGYDGTGKCHGNNVLTIIATGGGLVTRAGCRSLLKKTFCIYLKANAKTIENRLKNAKTLTDRPMLGCQSGQSLYKRITGLMETRESLYHECADTIVDTNGATIDEVATKSYQIISSLS